MHQEVAQVLQEEELELKHLEMRELKRFKHRLMIPLEL